VLKAVYSRSLKGAQSLTENLENVSLFSDDSGPGKTYLDLLLRDDIQAVIIALPIMRQAAFVEEALAAGKHVLSEKPIAETLQSAGKLLQFSKSSNVKCWATWSVAENYRYVEAYGVAATEVKKLGRILGFRAKNFVSISNIYTGTAWSVF
jgi:predicted dehydrogenase